MRLDKADGVADVTEQGPAQRAVAVVEDAHAVGAGSVVGVRAVEHQSRSTGAVVERDAAGRTLQRQRDHLAWDAYAVAVAHERAGSAQAFHGRRERQTRAGPFEHEQRGFVQRFALCRRDAGVETVTEGTGRLEVGHRGLLERVRRVPHRNGRSRDPQRGGGRWRRTRGSDGDVE